MIDYTESESDRFVEFHIHGKITAQDMEDVWDKVNKRIKDWGKIKILKQIDDFPVIEASAILKNISNGVKNIGHYGSTAVVTDKQWVETLSNSIGKVTGMNVKCFRNDQIDDARSWLAQQPN